MSSTRPRVIVLDFDGTMTDAELEGAPFRDGYLADLATLVGVPPDEPRFAAIVADVEGKLASAPAEHPFRWKGKAVAPASVDPYLRMVPIADAVFDAWGLLPDRDLRGRLTGGVLYKHNYARTLGKPVFRAGAAEVLRGLAGTETFVVTNSHTAAVAEKIDMLDRACGGGVAWLAPRVRGDAQKFEVDEGWDAVPATLAIPGLTTREVLLRRRRYHDRLAELVAGCGATFADLLVVGDIFELDLALPLALGARVGLVVSEHTPRYEIDFVGAQSRARVLHGLPEILALAGVG
jgi:hypothetical protein